jgi:transcriptional regulator with XRE-family HTH domain
VKSESETEIRRRLAMRVAAARKRKRWTQQTLAERCQLPRTYIADIEGERRNPSLRTLLRVSNALGIPVHELFLESPLA